MAQRRAADIRAAGAVVWRLQDRQLQVAVVHRDRYDDWSLPKGKLHAGEAELAAAVREVQEETGSSIAVSRRLQRARYDVDGARKEVAYWLARHRSGEFAASDEVDQLEWLTQHEATERLSYADERALVADMTPVPDTVVVLVRHAKAGKRSEWEGPDGARPLEATGRRQAQRLVDFLARFAPERIVSAEPERCVQTVTPLAGTLGLDVTVDPALGDAGFEASPEKAEAALLSLAVGGRTTVVCSQGGAIPGLIDRIAPLGRMPETRKGSAWVLAFVDGAVISADHYPDAAR